MIKAETQLVKIFGITNYILYLVPCKLSYPGCCHTGGLSSWPVVVVVKLSCWDSCLPGHFSPVKLSVNQDYV